MGAIRFVHCADLHLGAKFGMLPPEAASARRQQQHEAFAAAVDIAIDPAQPAHVFLIAGDAFDSERPHPGDLAQFERQLQRLRDHDVRTFVIPGNHDRYTPGSWWDRADLAAEAVFKQPGLQAHALEQLGLTVLALPPDPARSSVNLLRGAEIDVHTPRSILLLHATWLSFGREECEVECHPFATDDLAALAVDYVALGHYHHLSEATPPEGRPLAFYPGAPEAIDFGQRCDEPGAVIVGTIADDGTVSAEPHVVAAGRHLRLRVDCTHESAESLERAVGDRLQPGGYALVELTGMPRAELAVFAEQHLAARLQGRCAYLSVQTRFNELGAMPEDNVYFNKFREAIARKLADAAEEDKPKWRRALELGAVAFLSAQER